MQYYMQHINVKCAAMSSNDLNFIEVLVESPIGPSAHRFEYSNQLGCDKVSVRRTLLSRVLYCHCVTYKTNFREALDA